MGAKVAKEPPRSKTFKKGLHTNMAHGAHFEVFNTLSESIKHQATQNLVDDDANPINEAADSRANEVLRFHSSTTSCGVSIDETAKTRKLMISRGYSKTLLTKDIVKHFVKHLQGLNESVNIFS